MSNFDKITTYHGTSDKYIKDLIVGKVNTTLGGGELGQGFYLGDKLHVAKAWAKQMHNCEAVIEFQMDDNDFWCFNIESLTNIEAREKRSAIRNNGLTRTYKFLKDVVWSPIVGGPKIYADQYKWESKNDENYLNGNKVLRRRR